MCEAAAPYLTPGVLACLYPLDFLELANACGGASEGTRSVIANTREWLRAQQQTRERAALAGTIHSEHGGSPAAGPELTSQILYHAWALPVLAGPVGSDEVRIRQEQIYRGAL